MTVLAKLLFANDFHAREMMFYLDQMSMLTNETRGPRRSYDPRRRPHYGSDDQRSG
jgi:hypothetical protein